jgi:hypothetical protein
VTEHSSGGPFGDGTLFNEVRPAKLNGMRQRVISVCGMFAFAFLGCSRGESSNPTRPMRADLLPTAKAEDSERTKLRPVSPGETTPAIEQRAKEILEAHADAPLRTEIPFDNEGKSYIARIEEHYHEPGGPRRPWGPHRGVTVYHAR